MRNPALDIDITPTLRWIRENTRAGSAEREQALRQRQQAKAIRRNRCTHLCADQSPAIEDYPGGMVCQICGAEMSKTTPRARWAHSKEGAE